MKEMSVREFYEYCKEEQKKLKFKDLFKIECKKCGSEDIEFFGEYDDSGVYYAGEQGHNYFVVKCHNCGNAKGYDWFGQPEDLLE